jgi:hypothetical protein
LSGVGGIFFAASPRKRFASDFNFRQFRGLGHDSPLCRRSKHSAASFVPPRSMRGASLYRTALYYRAMDHCHGVARGSS